MRKTIAIIAGDGIGPEIVAEGIKVLRKIEQVYNHSFRFIEVLAGGAAIDQLGEPLPASTLSTCKTADSILLGAVGGPKWETLPGNRRPEQAIIGLRSQLGLYANIRPTKLFDALKTASPLKESIIDQGLDLIIVRELIGGLYIGQRETAVNKQGQLQAMDTLIYTEGEIERIGRVAFNLAMRRKKKLTSVDKANVLDSSRLWRKIMHNLKIEYPEVEYNDLLVDNCAMQLIRQPSQFDVIVTENMFGDILSDEASMLSGSIGLIPSMSLGIDNKGLYEPIHGSAPDIAGQNKANPIATILSVAMMLRYSFDLSIESKAIETAVEMVLNQGYATQDIFNEEKILTSCSQMGDLICDHII